MTETITLPLVYEYKQEHWFSNIFVVVHILQTMIYPKERLRTKIYTIHLFGYDGYNTIPGGVIFQF